MRSIFGMSLALTLAAGAGLASAQNTWSVGGGGDFASLVAAVAAPQVVDGDTLLVASGTYSAFVTSKALHILGDSAGAPPKVNQESRLHGCDFATVAGINFTELLCQDIPGRLVLEDCDVGHTGISGYGGTIDTFRIEGCAEAVVSNAVLQGKTGDITWVESPGVHVMSSNAVLVNCTLLGGKGGNGDTAGFPGQPGATIEDGSVVTIAGCTLTGGNGGMGLELCQSDGGTGVDVQDSVLWLRGNSDDVVSGGHNCPSGVNFALWGFGSTFTVSGVTLAAPGIPPGLTGSNTLIQPFPAEPYLWIGGNPAPGGMRRLNVAGPVGAQALVLFSLQPLHANVPKLIGGSLWLDPGAVLIQLELGLIGQELPINVNLPLPAGADFAGVTAWAQGFVPAAGGKFLALNPASIVLRF